jgi:hypothetical protein
LSFLLAPVLVMQVAAPPGMPPRAEVMLEGRAIVVPALPTSIAQARREFSRVRKDLEAAFREAERYRTTCKAELAAQEGGAGDLVIPAAHAAEARALAPFLFDEEFLALEAPVLERWNPWQTTLLRLGLDEPGEGQRIAEHMLLLSTSKAEVAESSHPGAEAPSLEIRSDDPVHPESTFLHFSTRVALFELVAVDRMAYGANTEFARKATTFADQQAPGLAESWVKLSGHLNQSAGVLLGLDRAAAPSKDPAMVSQRLRARVNFMERFRSTLWLCQVIWAHMASQKILPIQDM